jgi:hypothetical protein
MTKRFCDRCATELTRAKVDSETFGLPRHNSDMPWIVTVSVGHGVDLCVPCIREIVKGKPA